MELSLDIKHEFPSSPPSQRERLPADTRRVTVKEEGGEEEEEEEGGGRAVPYPCQFLFTGASDPGSSYDFSKLSGSDQPGIGTRSKLYQPHSQVRWSDCETLTLIDIISQLGVIEELERPRQRNYVIYQHAVQVLASRGIIRNIVQVRDKFKKLKYNYLAVRDACKKGPAGKEVQSRFRFWSQMDQLMSQKPAVKKPPHQNLHQNQHQTQNKTQIQTQDRGEEGGGMQNHNSHTSQTRLSPAFPPPPPSPPPEHSFIMGGSPPSSQSNQSSNHCSQFHPPAAPVCISSALWPSFQFDTGSAGSSGSSPAPSSALPPSPTSSNSQSGDQELPITPSSAASDNEGDAPCRTERSLFFLKRRRRRRRRRKERGGGQRCCCCEGGQLSQNATLLLLRQLVRAQCSSNRLARLTLAELRRSRELRERAAGQESRRLDRETTEAATDR